VSRGVSASRGRGPELPQPPGHPGDPPERCQLPWQVAERWADRAPLRRCSLGAVKRRTRRCTRRRRRMLLEGWPARDQQAPTWHPRSPRHGQEDRPVGTDSWNSDNIIPNRVWRRTRPCILPSQSQRHRPPSHRVAVLHRLADRSPRPRSSGPTAGRLAAVGSRYSRHFPRPENLRGDAR
jgi:hypothetical protein